MPTTTEKGDDVYLEILCILQLAGQQDIQADKVQKLTDQFKKFNVNVDRFVRDQVAIMYRYV